MEQELRDLLKEAVQYIFLHVDYWNMLPAERDDLFGKVDAVLGTNFLQAEARNG